MNVVRANPQKIDYKGHDTTVLDASCKGVGASQTRSGRPVYRYFYCLVHFHDDELDTGPLAMRLYVATSKKTPGALACWNRSLARVQSCR